MTVKLSRNLKRSLGPPSLTSYDMVDEGLSRRHLDPVLISTPEDWSRDGIELRRPPRGHVLLHRTSQSVRSPF
jgi:hypothetical protein